MAIAGAPTTMAELYEKEPDNAIPYDMAVRITSVLKLNKELRPDTVRAPRRVLSPVALPLKMPPPPTVRGRRPGTCTYVVDVILDAPNDFDYEAIVGLMKANH